MGITIPKPSMTTPSVRDRMMRFLRLLRIPCIRTLSVRHDHAVSRTLHNASSAVHQHAVACLEADGGVAATDDGGDAQLAGDDGGVGQ